MKHRDDHGELDDHNRRHNDCCENSEQYAFPVRPAETDGAERQAFDARQPEENDQRAAPEDGIAAEQVPERVAMNQPTADWQHAEGEREQESAQREDFRPPPGPFLRSCHHCAGNLTELGKIRLSSRPNADDDQQVLCSRFGAAGDRERFHSCTAQLEIPRAVSQMNGDALFPRPSGRKTGYPDNCCGSD